MGGEWRGESNSQRGGIGYLAFLTVEPKGKRGGGRKIKKKYNYRNTFFSNTQTLTQTYLENLSRLLSGTTRLADVF